ncbi:hypothetical protein [Mucilaginibacter sp. L3T2-6]|uniref:hypothetical protein n=1 Tax=Mucilaginibacter sp. L3T2-6 TaxID=3062491 RepID=UPI0026752F15|nr:hypothetical protein [Mucilaginibacter sp. L3T2-6]MDO3642566.1 hypothetical protein [Mucilaginibacter sp. L3T2-6]MDV6215038.1 hypothetical protein [Mucilaginibacter sp. L3T2-6]
MKKYILIIITTILSLSANAQKLEKPIIDKITGDTTFSTKTEVLANPFALIQHAITVSTIRTKNEVLLSFHLKDALNIYYSVLKGDTTVIKFTDGRLLKITAALDSHSSFLSGGTLTYVGSDIYYALSGQEMDILKNKKIAFIRIMTSKGAFDYDIKNGKSEIVKKQLELITKQ